MSKENNDLGDARSVTSVTLNFWRVDRLPLGDLAYFALDAHVVAASANTPQHPRKKQTSKNSFQAQVECHISPTSAFLIKELNAPDLRFGTEVLR